MWSVMPLELRGAQPLEVADPHGDGGLLQLGRLKLDEDNTIAWIRGVIQDLIGQALPDGKENAFASTAC